MGQGRSLYFDFVIATDINVRISGWRDWERRLQVFFVIYVSEVYLSSVLL